MREHPSSGESGGVVHVTAIDDIQQRVAQAMVLLEERPSRPLAALLQQLHRVGAVGMGVAPPPRNRTG
jgi:hypothetical protein